MDIIELLIIILLSIFQSIFGIGLLLIGTPTFLLLDYNFFNVLNILLPFSITISLLQVMYSKEIDSRFNRRIILYSIPSLILALSILLKYENSIDFILLISFTIIFFSIINLSKFKNIIFNDSDKRINIGLVALGLIHGFTNLGGSFFALLCANINKQKKLIRHNIASGYLILGIAQLLFINIFYQTLVISNLYYLYIPIISFFIAQYFYNKINSQLFLKILNITMLLYGIYIFLNSL
ncbi:TSUP family transporter [Gammaproteobacteria bacterium]|nr:TSUP family transporter [Gammaproteobacteria bacterium]